MADLLKRLDAATDRANDKLERLHRWFSAVCDGRADVPEDISIRALLRRDLPPRQEPVIGGPVAG